MTPEEFFTLLQGELEQNETMHKYYKFHQNDASFYFRKNYFLARLNYIYDLIKDPNAAIWDCGCGYGTTCLFLAMNGIKTFGTTLEFYFDTIEERKKYWSQFGNTDLFSYAYEDLFSEGAYSEKYDVLILQDTLHHLEPIDQALNILNQSLKPGGILIAIEENGQNLIQSAKLYKYRGNKRIITIFDEKLQKDILLGNENIRSMKHWTRLFEEKNFKIDQSSVQYIRYYLPFMYNAENAASLFERENLMQRHSSIRKKYFFFGINFVAKKNN